MRATLPLVLALVGCGARTGLESEASRSAGASTEPWLVFNVTESNAGNTSNNPAWGPTGLIAFQQEQDIYVIPATGGAVRNLTTALSVAPASVAYPTWAPAGAPID